MRAAARVGVAGVGAAACLAFAAPAAQAKVLTARAAGDPQTTYTVGPKVLTISSTDPVLLQFVRDSTVRVICFPSTAEGSGWMGYGFWGPNASSVAVRSTRRNLPHPQPTIPTDLAHCLADVIGGGAPGFIGEGGTQFSKAGFTPGWRTRLASTPPPGPLLARAQLTEEWDTLDFALPTRFLNRYGQLGRLPPATTLVQMANLYLNERGAELLYAPTLAGVTVPHIAYVIGQGSGRKRLVMAVIGLDGKPYLLRARIGSLRGKFGPA